MIFSFPSDSCFKRVIKRGKPYIIIFLIIALLDKLFTDHIGGITLYSFAWLTYLFLVFTFRFNKFYIERLSIEGRSLTMKVYRFNELLSDTNRAYDLSELKLSITKSALSLYNTDYILKIETPDFYVKQFDTNGWTKQMFDDIIAYTNQPH